MAKTKTALNTTTVRVSRWGITALALGYVLGRAGLAEAQEGRITVLSPTSDDEIHAGDTVTVSFNTTGEAVDGPYDLDLFKGVNQISSWCEDTEGCETDDGSFRVVISPSHDVGPGYYISVSDRTSSISGESEVFMLLPERASDATDIPLTPEYQEEIAAGGFVGDMSLGLLIVAGICGLSLVCALCVACIMVSRRKAAVDLKLKETTPDFELGGPLDRTTPGRMQDSYSSEGRGFSGGNPIMRNRSFSVGGSTKSFANSPARSMAMGDQQRGRSQSRDSTGPRMYSSNTPSRARGSSTSPGPGGRRFSSYDGSGGAMVVVTPGRSNSGRSGRSRTPRRLMSGGDRSRSRGRQMYDRSSVPSWDESGGRMMATSRSPGKQLSVGRPDSTGRARRPPRYMMQGGDLADGSRGDKRMTMTPGRRRPARDGHHDESPHILGIRRSKSAGHGLAWQGEEDAAAFGDGRRWEDRGMMAAVGQMERGRRSQRPLSKSARSKSMHDTSDNRRAGTFSGSSDSYGREKRSRSKPTTPSRRQSYSRSGMGDRDDPSTNSDVSWEELRSTYLKSRIASRRSYSLPSYGDAVHHADEGDSVDGRAPPPSYGPRDAESSSECLSIGIPNDPSPSSYKSSSGRRSRSRGPAKSNGPASSKKSSGSYSNRSASASSKSPSGRFSPGTRAVSARKAARDAQLSAERALAAAAMASRAADLAAQAALEAEAEADAELVDDDLDSFEEVEMSPPSKSSSGEVEGSLVREKIKVFGGGSTLGSSITSFDRNSSKDDTRAAGKSPFSRHMSGSWSQAGDVDVTAKSVRPSADPKESLASGASSNGGGGGGEAGSSSSSVKPKNSWSRNGVRGPDTAGGSATANGFAGKGDVGDHRNGNGFTAANGSAPAPALPSDPTELAMRRRAFVKQYSGASDLAEDSDYSLHDNAAASAIAAVIGRPGTGHGRVGSATMTTWDKTSLDGSGSMSYSREEAMRAGELAAREDDVAEDGEGQGDPKRGRPESSDRGRSADRDIFAGNSRPSVVAGPSH
ncbi:unnamed protein product [Scytosiphon promiscuus]